MWLTGASSMQRRLTGASSRSKHCSWMSAETVAPTPPELVLSSRMQILLVRESDARIVAMSSGLSERSSIRSMSSPSAW